MRIYASRVISLVFKRLPRRPGLVKLLAAAALFAAVAAATSPSAALAGTHVPALFGAREVRSADSASAPKWTGMLERYVEKFKPFERPCGGSGADRCYIGDWIAFLDGLRSLDPMTQLVWVNYYMNRAPYVTDMRNYARPDYWATPLEFLSRGGDCEDYAVAKFLSLRTLGWVSSDMRIVVLEDLSRGIPHAVLVVFRDGVAWVLDNQIKQVIAADRIQHYRPNYSVNEDGGWLYWFESAALKIAG